ncbi:MAG: DUF2934 domain-containing protein [Terriglobales bacterium]|jgi:hypothetical protein
MPRKSNGSTPIRSKKITPTTESVVVQSTPVQSAPEVIKNAVTTVVAASKTGVNTTNASMDEEIRRRAYELYLQRNGKAGDPNRDWFVAEREVRARHATAGHSA